MDQNVLHHHLVHIMDTIQNMLKNLKHPTWNETCLHFYLLEPSQVNVINETTHANTSHTRKTVLFTYTTK